jgi:hypothetical protein
MLPAAGLVLVIAVSGCTRSPAAARVNAAASASTTAAVPSPTPAPPPSTSPPSTPTPAASHSASPHPAATTHTTHRPATSHPKPGAVPRVGTPTVSPKDFDACHSTRPTATVKVTDADDPPSALHVTASYYINEHYQGNARMHYDAGRGLFVVQLPAVTKIVAADFPGISGGHLDVYATATDPAGNVPRPGFAAVATVEGCG